MRKRALLAGFIFMVAVAWCVSAYAADGSGTSGWENFWNGVSGFFYNALPWNWGNWAAK